jgi:hypothetical protein
VGVPCRLTTSGTPKGASRSLFGSTAGTAAGSTAGTAAGPAAGSGGGTAGLDGEDPLLACGEYSIRCADHQTAGSWELLQHSGCVTLSALWRNVGQLQLAVHSLLACVIPPRCACLDASADLPALLLSSRHRLQQGCAGSSQPHARSADRGGAIGCAAACWCLGGGELPLVPEPRLKGAKHLPACKVAPR